MYRIHSAVWQDSAIDQGVSELGSRINATTLTCANIFIFNSETIQDISSECCYVAELRQRKKKCISSYISKFCTYPFNRSQILQPRTYKKKENRMLLQGSLQKVNPSAIFPRKQMFSLLLFSERQHFTLLVNQEARQQISFQLKKRKEWKGHIKRTGP